MNETPKMKRDRLEAERRALLGEVAPAPAPAPKKEAPKAEKPAVPDVAEIPTVDKIAESKK